MSTLKCATSPSTVTHSPSLLQHSVKKTHLEARNNKIFSKWRYLPNYRSTVLLQRLRQIDSFLHACRWNERPLWYLGFRSRPSSKIWNHRRNNYHHSQLRWPCSLLSKDWQICQLCQSTWIRQIAEREIPLPRVRSCSIGSRFLQQYWIRLIINKIFRSELTNAHERS